MEIPILGSILSYFSAKRIKQEEKVEEKLKIHFDDIKKSVTSKIVTMSNNLCLRNSRLVFGGIAPVDFKHNFEEEQDFECFKVHFPDEFNEWETLKEDAIKSSQELVAFYEFHKGHNADNTANERIETLRIQFKTFSSRLNTKMETVGKYQMGKGFKNFKSVLSVTNSKE